MSAFTRTLVFAVAAATGLWAQDMYSITVVGGSPGPANIAAAAINKSGQVVTGWICEPGSGCGGIYGGSFLYSGGVVTALPFGKVFTAINDGGQIVGSCCSFVGSQQAYVYSGGAMTALGFLPGGVYSNATGINNAGLIVGYSQDPSGNNEAFLYRDGAMTGLGTLPGYSASVANGVNNGGQVVGYAQSSSGHKEAFLYSGGVMTDLGTLPGYTDSVATAINDTGQIVGYATDSSGNSQAFLWDAGGMAGLGTLSFVGSSQAAAINNRGQIVGISTLPSGPTAFLYSGGRMYDLNTLSFPEMRDYTGFVFATGINDSGQIVAMSFSIVYLLTPLAGTPHQGRFVPVTPCRAVDTRFSVGPLGGPALDGRSWRSFAIPTSACEIPTTAQAYSLNVTVVPHGPLSYLTLWPTGMDQPVVSTLNSFEGNVVANAAIAPAGQNGAVSVFASANSPTDVILDINGYFDSTAGDSFYPLQPHRVADTRRGADSLGGPSLSAGETRDFPIALDSFLPMTAAAYSMNVTVVPDGYLGFLTAWPTGQPQPFASTLNSWTGKVAANAAIVPAGANGSTSVYVTNPTDVILDINGYFAPAGSPGAATFYPVAPCRVEDTRETGGGPVLAAGETRSFAIPESGCGIPSSAAAYALNITVVPDGPLSYLTAWPTGSPKPFVSTLNSFDGTVVANAAIVPAGTDGAVSVYVTNQTHVILDINGYFAP
ncbi:MAG TPA: hypothetical protein VN893_15990 [Bryobacteraceae bacterium]|nr:hypothetical protein [Bryobacteraceae bacterium]